MTDEIMMKHRKEITHEVFGTFHLLEDITQVELEAQGDAVTRRLRGKLGQPAKNRATVQSAQDSGILLETVLPDEPEAYEKVMRSINPSMIVWLAKEINTAVFHAYDYPSPVEEKN